MSLPVCLAGTRRRLFLKLIANSFIQSFATIGTGLLIQGIFDSYLHDPEGQGLGLIGAAGAGLIAIALLVACLRMQEYATAERLGQDYTEAVRLALFDCMQQTAVRSVQKRARGATLLRFIGDLNALRRWVSLGLSRIVVAIVTSAGATVALLLLHWPLALIAFVTLFTGTVFMMGQGGQMRAAVRETRRRRSRLATNIAEKVSSLAVIQVFGRASIERRRISRQSDRLKQAVVQQARVTGRIRGISEATVALTTTSVILLGVVELRLGHCTPGTVIATMGIISMLRGPLSSLARVYEYYQTAEVARNKLNDFLAMPAFSEVPHGSPVLRVGKGDIEYEMVTVDGALNEFAARIEAGQVIALIGPNGSGKTTLMAATARLVAIDRGRIVIDGQDLAGCSLSSIRQAISMLSPDLPLMRGTIESNLKYRCPDASDGELQRVIDLCEIDTIIEAIEGGLQARVSEGGSNLSPGQRQKISIARAILHKPKVLLLDEVEENLDPRSARIIDRILADIDATVLLVTHRADRIELADQVWYMEDGRLIDSGTVDRMMSIQGPGYRHFHENLRRIS